MQELCNPSEFLSQYGFKDLDERIFLAAFTHPSYGFEHGLSENESYERLEFLGDAVLKLVMSKMLFEKFHIDEKELYKFLTNKYNRAYSIWPEAINPIERIDENFITKLCS